MHNKPLTAAIFAAAALFTVAGRRFAGLTFPRLRDLAPILVVWAIAEGRSTARAVDEFLMGASDLPSPVKPAQLPLSVR